MHSLYKDTENTEILLTLGHRWEKWEIIRISQQLFQRREGINMQALRRGNESGDDRYDG